MNRYKRINIKSKFSRKSVEIEAFEAGIIRDIYVTTTKNVTEEGEIWIVNITTSIESATDGSGMPGSILSFTVIPPEEGSEALAELKTSRILKDENKNRTYYAWASFNFKAVRIELKVRFLVRLKVRLNLCLNSRIL